MASMRSLSIVARRIIVPGSAKTTVLRSSQYTTAATAAILAPSSSFCSLVQQQQRESISSMPGVRSYPPHQQHKLFKSTMAAYSEDDDDEQPPPSPPPLEESRDTYNVSQTWVGPEVCAQVGIATLGITQPTTIYRNLTYAELYDHEQQNHDGVVAQTAYGPTMAVSTGHFTGRSPHDKYFVDNGPDSPSAQHIDWNAINQPTTPAVFATLHTKAVDYFNTLKEVYVLDCYVGASPTSRKKIRFVHEMAWQQHFCTNMFIRPVEPHELEEFEPDFTVMNACAATVDDYEELGLNSDTAVVFNIEAGAAVIFGTYYGGENKKGIFSLMNYLLPLSSPHPQLPMHCSANVAKDDANDVCLFFGLSGTGKTTLSADPRRALIGDDEHGWDEHGVYNFEGGCYAKTINLSEATEPDIYRAIHTDALLENVKMVEQEEASAPTTGSVVVATPDYNDTSITENGRVSYPIFHVDDYHKEQMAGHPTNIIFLSCDAFGVLPPVAKLSSGEAMYHFLSGYTAKVAGTERGVKEPSATFSTCFGAAFMTLHPTVYADLLQQKLDTHGTNCYLVNSGWAGGPYGEGERMSIQTTRTCIDAILDGSIGRAEFKQHPIFGFDVPASLAGVDPDVLDIRSTWSSPEAYDEQAQKLGRMYIENFKKYEGKGSIDYTKFGPRI